MHWKVAKDDSLHQSEEQALNHAELIDGDCVYKVDGTIVSIYRRQSADWWVEHDGNPIGPRHIPSIASQRALDSLVARIIAEEQETSPLGWDSITA